MAAARGGIQARAGRPGGCHLQGRTMKWILVWACGAALAASSAAVSAEEAENLFEAKKKGKVEFEAISMFGFEKIEITVKNLTPALLRLNPAGSVLIPPDGALQRLGLAGVVGGVPGEDSALIVIPPNGSWTGEINAVCLDFGKGTPPNGVKYSLSGTPADESALEVLRYWADNPQIKQTTVNDIIWSGRRLDTLKSQVLPAWLIDARIIVNGGKMLFLTGSGVLYQVADDALSWSKIGENLDSAAASGGQIAGYIEKIPGLRWYNLSQRSWEYFFLPSSPAKVLLGPDRTIFALCGGTIYRWAPGQKEFAAFSAGGISDAAMSPAAVSPAICALKADSGTVLVYDRAQEAWSELQGGGFSKVGASSKSVYASSAAGVARFQGKWRRIHGSPADFEAGSGKCFIVAAKRVIVYDEGADSLSQPADLPRTAMAWAVDRITDSFYVLDEQAKVHKLSDSGTWLLHLSVPELSGRKD